MVVQNNLENSILHPQEKEQPSTTISTINSENSQNLISSGCQINDNDKLQQQQNLISENYNINNTNNSQNASNLSSQNIDLQQQLQQKKLSTNTSFIDQQQLYQESQYRHINTAVYFLTCLTSCIGESTFIPITTQVVTTFGVSNTQANMSILLFYLILPFVNFSANYVLDSKYGLKIGMTVGQFFITLGIFVRIFINESWIYVLIGQSLIACGIPFIQNCPSKVSAAWYNVQNRTQMSMVFTFAILMSAPLGVIIPTFFINPKTGDVSFDQLLHFEMYLQIGVLIINLILFRSKPDVSPSESQNVEQKEPFRKSLKNLFKNKNYILIFSSEALFLGTVSGFVAVLSFWLDPFGFGAFDTAILAIVMLFAGVIGCACTGAYIKKTQEFKKAIIICLVIGGSIFFTTFLTLYSHNIIYVSLVFAASQFFLFPVISTQLEFANEIAFPIGEATVTGFLFAGGELVGFVVGLILNLIIDGKDKAKSFYGVLFVFVSFLISATCVYYVKNDLKRFKFDSQLSESESEAIDKEGELEEKTQEYIIQHSSLLNPLIKEESQ